MDEVELGLPVEDLHHRREEVTARVTPEALGAKRLGDRRHESPRNRRVARGERRHLVAAPDELGNELVDDALGAAVRVRRDALDGRRDLGDAQ